LALPKDDSTVKPGSLESDFICVHLTPYWNFRSSNSAALRLRFIFLSSMLLLASCGRTEKTGQSEEEKTAPEITRSQRPPREALPDQKEELREQLAKARMSGEPEERDKLLVQVAWNAMELDPELARGAFESLMLESPDRIALIQHFAMRMADENPEEALKWAASLESEREAAAARVRIALVLADSDPSRAANLLSEHGLANREFEVAVVQVLQRWSNKSPQDAAAWVAVFPPGEFRKAGVETVISGWLGSDPQAAFTWVSSLGDEAIRTEAGNVLAKKFLRQTPETRDVWLGYADSEIREKFTHAQRQTRE
jgi:hypothetical protein